MALDFIPFRAWHLYELDQSCLQGLSRNLLTDIRIGEMLATEGIAWSGVRDSGIVGFAGILPVWEGRARAWAIFGRILPGEWVPILRKTAEQLDAMHGRGFRRIEADIRADFPIGCRFAERLGFVRETPSPARGYNPDGSDAYLYARIAELAS